MIKYISPLTYLMCGQSCVAMLADISIEEAIKKMGTSGSTEPDDIIKGLRACGIKCSELVRILDDVESYPPVCILIIWFNDYGHAVVHYHGKFYDPESGVLDEYKPLGGKIGSYILVDLDEKN